MASSGRLSGEKAGAKAEAGDAGTKKKGGPKTAQFRLSGSLFLYRPVSACGLTGVQGERTHPGFQKATGHGTLGAKMCRA